MDNWVVSQKEHIPVCKVHRSFPSTSPAAIVVSFILVLCSVNKAEVQYDNVCVKYNIESAHLSEVNGQQPPILFSLAVSPPCTKSVQLLSMSSSTIFECFIGLWLRVLLEQLSAAPQRAELRSADCSHFSQTQIRIGSVARCLMRFWCEPVLVRVGLWAKEMGVSVGSEKKNVQLLSNNCLNRTISDFLLEYKPGCRIPWLCYQKSEQFIHLFISSKCCQQTETCKNLQTAALKLPSSSHWTICAVLKHIRLQVWNMK